MFRFEGTLSHNFNNPVSGSSGAQTLGHNFYFYGTFDPQNCHLFGRQSTGSVFVSICPKPRSGMNATGRGINCAAEILQHQVIILYEV